MGWKASCIFVSDRGPEIFRGPLQHEEERDAAVLRQLGIPNYEVDGASDLSAGIYPRDGFVYLGDYGGGLIVAEDHLPGWLIAEEGGRAISGKSTYAPAAADILFATYPKASVFALTLHSVVNLWGFAWYEKGQRVRAIWGSADDGVMLDIGTPFPEEAVAMEPGEPLDVYGEEICFAVSARMLGVRLDELPFEKIGLTRFKPVPKVSWLKSLFGRR